MKIVCVGFGLVAQTLIPLLMARMGPIGMAPSQITVFSDVASGQQLAQVLAIDFVLQPITKVNYQRVLSARLAPGVVLLNLAVGVSTVDLIVLAQAHGAMYLDTCVEPWAGGYEDSCVHKTTNGWLRQQALALRGVEGTRALPTAVLAHGANPGLVSHFVKQALLDMAHFYGGPALDRAFGLLDGAGIAVRSDWARLARLMDVRVVQIAERDTQADLRSAALAPQGSFQSTWSPRGLLTELSQPLECGWGTHETNAPHGAEITSEFGPVSMYQPRVPQAAPAVVWSWTPSGGPRQALAITHHEALSITSWLSLPGLAGEAYRPTCYYAYRPCALTRASIGRWLATGCEWPQEMQCLSWAQIAADGFDELGVLLCTRYGSYWYGSTLSAAHALRHLHLPSCGNATTVQVAAGILGALAWMRKYPSAGVVEAEDMDSSLVLDVARPFLGSMRGTLSDWIPGSDLVWDEFQIPAKDIAL